MPKTNWEKRFDEMFKHIDKCGEQKVDAHCYCGHEQIKLFISQLLRQEAEKMYDLGYKKGIADEHKCQIKGGEHHKNCKSYIKEI